MYWESAVVTSFGLAENEIRTFHLRITAWEYKNPHIFFTIFKFDEISAIFGWNGYKICEYCERFLHTLINFYYKYIKYNNTYPLMTLRWRTYWPISKDYICNLNWRKQFLSQCPPILYPLRSIFPRSLRIDLIIMKTSVIHTRQNKNVNI